MGVSLVSGCGTSKNAEATKNSDGKVEVDFWYSGGKTAVNVYRIL